MKFTDSEKQKMEPKIENVKCLMCGNSDVQYLEYPTHVIGFPKTGDDYDFTKVSYLNCVSGVCQKCGYVMQFAVDVLTK